VPVNADQAASNVGVSRCLPLIVAALLMTGCTAPEGPANEPFRSSYTFVSTERVPPPSDSASGDGVTEISYSEPETQLIALMTRVGVQHPGVHEHGYRDAWVYGEWSQRGLLVHSFPEGTPSGTGGRLAIHVIAGIEVSVYANRWYGATSRFTCDHVRYDVSSIESIDNLRTGDVATELAIVRKMLADLQCS
jgi:hypothetical protein